MCKRLFSLIPLVVMLVAANNASAVMVAHWSLDEGSGAVAHDVTGNGHDAAVGGTANWVVGKIGGALDFDGTSTYIDMNDRVVTGTWSLALWLKPRDIPYSSGYYAVMHDDVWGAGAMHLHLRNTTSLLNADFNAGPDVTSTTVLQANEWYHAVITVTDQGGDVGQMYINGVLEDTGQGGGGGNYLGPLNFGAWTNNQRFYHGVMDDIRIYDHVLSQAEVLTAMQGQPWPYAIAPKPADGAIYPDTWVTLSWTPGGYAASHDVYLGESFEDVNGATHDSNTFRGNQTGTFYVAGFPGYAYPDGLVPGTTYYWRIDEVNDAEPNSPWKGPVWSFSIPPKTAYSPGPANGSESVALTANLTWTAGFGAKLHTVYFGDNFDTVANATGGLPQGTTTYTPSGLKMAKTYYWRVDEFDGTNTYKGDVWSFTTVGAVGGANPANGAVDVKPTTLLTWTAGAIAASHEVYFGTDPNAVKNATKTSPEYKGSKALGDESYDPGKLELETSYYWRIDEVNAANPDSPWKGNVWSFTTGDYYVIDDFEEYTDNDTANEAIWQTWVDGFGVADNGAQVGYLVPPYAEQTIVHGGAQSMPLLYNNTGGVTNSEASLAMTVQRDWTEGGVANLSLWFRGNPGSVGSFVEAPAGTYTMTGSGADVWGNADQFHFAYKTLTGAGSIIAKVESVQNTNAWAKAGVMIRETLEPGSKHAFVAVTPGNGVASQGRDTTDGTSFNTNQTGLTAPYWVKLERDAAGNFTASQSADGTTWQPVQNATPTNIPMSTNVYVGLALTSHDAALTCQAVFSHVTMTGTVSGQWADQDIGIASNAAEPLYVAVSSSGGQPAVVAHPDPAAAQIDTWTQWVIPLSAFSGQGVNLTNVDKIAIGLGAKSGMTAPGGSGTIYIDDIRLDRPTTP
jgi:Concanavalin A-like lectin/glucanases superfamily